MTKQLQITEVKKTIMSPAMTKQFQNALPKDITVERFQRVLMTSISSNPELMKCDQESLFSACMTAAQLGLYTDSFLGEGHLVSYSGKVAFQPGYRGLIKLAKRSNDITGITAHVVYSNDQFSYTLGDDEAIYHKPAMTDRGERVGAYSIARFSDGSIQREFVPVEYMMKIKKSAKTKYIWDGDFSDAMWRKSAVKQLTKWIPLDSNYQQAVAIDSQAEIGRPAYIKDDGIVIDSEPEPINENGRLVAAMEESDEKKKVDTNPSLAPKTNKS